MNPNKCKQLRVFDSLFVFIVSLRFLPISFADAFLLQVSVVVCGLTLSV